MSSWEETLYDSLSHHGIGNLHEAGYVNYVKGANVAGFMKVANAMMAQGIV